LVHSFDDGQRKFSVRRRKLELLLRRDNPALHCSAESFYLHYPDGMKIPRSFFHRECVGFCVDEKFEGILRVRCIIGVIKQTLIMKKLKTITAIVLTIPFLTSPFAALAADTKTPLKAKPDLLTTCPVSGDKLGGMGDPFVFEYKGQEVKLCCKDCKAKFDKEPAKYIKMIEEADAKAKK
jgi:YHS domain-containing protein